MEHQNKNTKTNTLYIEYLEKKFKNVVRSILSDLENYPYYASLEQEEAYDDEQLFWLQNLIREYKCCCVEMWECDYLYDHCDIHEMFHKLDILMSNFHVRTIWYEGDYNSLIIDIDAYRYEMMNRPNDNLPF